MRILSLFDGISCGMAALHRAGFSVSRYDAFEIDPYALSVSEKNYPEIYHHGDVFSGKFNTFSGYDLLLGGSPCTYWSIARKNREITSSGEGYRLFQAYVNALYQSKCRYFLYENNASIHQQIKDAISHELGVPPIILNSSLVSAQHRKRCYWTNIPDIDIPKDKHIILQDILLPTDSSMTSAVSEKEHLQWNDVESIIPSQPNKIGQYGKGGQGQRIYSVLGKSVTVLAKGGGKGKSTGLYRIDFSDGHYLVRNLTPVEAERLQTLPDNYTEGIPTTKRYQCIGNAWTVDIISHILQYITV